MNDLKTDFVGESKSKLKRTITLPHLVLYGAGSMIGAGIYVLIGIIAGHAQFYTPVAFLLAGLVGLLTALSYAELSRNFPFSAGAALFVHHAFKHNLLSKTVGYLVILTGIVSCGALAKGFSGYARELIDINYDLMVFIFIVSLGLIACWKIHMSMWVISVISLVEILGLFFIMIILLPDFEFSKIAQKTFSIPTPGEILGLLNASLLAFYAFIGFEDMVNVAEEVKDNRRTMQKGIIYAFLLSMIIYLLISIITVASIDINVLTRTRAPFAEALLQYTPWGSKLISIISIIATINGALIQIIMSSRVFYGMAQKKMGMHFFGRINSVTHTPINAIIFTVIMILIFAYFLPIEQLAKLTSFIILIIFCLVNLSLIKLMMKKLIPNKRLVHFLLPVLAFISSLALLLSQLYIEVMAV